MSVAENEQATFLEPEERPVSYNMTFDIDQLPSDEELEGDPPTDQMVRSIMRFGLLEPIILRVEGDSFAIIDGRNRLKAVREAVRIFGPNMRLPGPERYYEPSRNVAARVYPDVDAYLAYTLTLVANEQRRRNPASDITAIEALLRAGYSESQIRLQTGMTPSTFRQRLRLLRLTPMLRGALARGTISCNFAEAAARLSRSLQEELEAELATRKPTLKLIGEIKRARAVEAQESLPASMWGETQEGSVTPLMLMYSGTASHVRGLLDAMPVHNGRTELLQLRAQLKRVDFLMSKIDPAMLEEKNGR